MPNVLSPPADEPGDDGWEAAFRKVIDSWLLPEFRVSHFGRSSAGASTQILGPDFRLAMALQSKRLDDHWASVRDVIAKADFSIGIDKALWLFEVKRVLPADSVLDVDVTTAPVPPDVALFMRLVEIWHTMWNEAGRYGPAGLKIRRGLIVFLALILVTFVLDVGVAQAHLTDHQLAEVTVVEGAVALGVAVAKK